jgi:putative effector of murein hydrolase
MSLNYRAAVLHNIIGTPLAIEQVRVRSGSAFASPVLTAIALVAIMVLATETDRKSYFAGAQFINVLLSPATTALAIPLARNARLIRENLHSISLALLAGSITSIVSGIGWVARRPRDCRHHRPWRRSEKRTLR